jgi:hypothetical protein
MIRPLAPLVILLCAASTVLASPKVALTAIDGDSAGDVREAVASALDGKDLTLIGMKEVNRAFDKLGDVSDLSEKAAKKLAKELEADAIVRGKLGKQNGKKKLSFELFVNGKKVKGFSVQFKSAKSAAFAARVHEKMVEKIEGGGSAEVAAEDEPKKKGAKATPVEDEEDPLAGKGKAGAKGDKKKGTKVAAVEDEEDPTAKKGKPAKKKTKAEMLADAEAMAAEEEAAAKKKKKADKEAEAEAAAAPAEKEVAKEDAKPADDEEAETKPAKKKVAAAEDGEDIGGETAVSARASRGGGGGMHTANRAAARLDVGVSVMSRQLLFTSNLDANQAPKPFKPSPVPGARFEADLYPLAFMNPNSIAAGLGLGVEYDKTLTMTLGTQAEPGVKIPVNAQHYMFSGKFRLAFGKTATSPTVALGFGYGRRRFIADRTKLAMAESLDLPDTDYKYLAPSLEVRIPIGTFIAFVMNGNAMLVRDAGAISKASSYGKAKIFGFDAAGGLDIVLGSRFAVRLIGEFEQVGYAFVGAGGEQANSRDDDPTDRDVGGAADRSFGGAATLAVHY